jgi:putative two-component system response regulator
MIMLTGREGAKQRMEGLCAGADAFLNKPIDPEELLVCLKTAERILSLETRDLALFALAKLAESRDSDTGAHIERVQSYTRLLARNLSTEIKACYGVDEEYIRLLYQTSPLHDLGKVGIPDSILLKPGKLTASEFAIMKTHTIVGAQTLDAALRRFPNARFLQLAREIAATHHEKFDGSGYPYGLVGEQIPLCGRIVAVADVYDALTNRRVYKEAITHQEAKAIIVRDRGSHFDPEVVDAFLRAEQDILAVRQRLRDEAAPPIAPVPVVTLPPPTSVGPNPCKILVVEDDPLLLEKLTELLRATGEQVYPTASGEEALRILAEHGPRVVVSDWVMPPPDGVELCRRIRARPDAAPVHFIMLTAHSEKGRLLDAFQAGVDDFLSKPFDPEGLLARVRAGIRTAKLYDELLSRATGSQALNAQLAMMNSRLERLAITDELTGLFNRRHAMLRLEEQWALAERYGRPLTIATIDIDHFKNVNDTYGHDAGDTVLRQIACLLREQTRGTDTICRFGGEEFLIIFPMQTSEEGYICAERCRTAVAAQDFKVGETTIKATVSIGLASRVRGMNQYLDLLKSADQALYAAKAAGRHAVRIADHLESRTSMSNAPTLSDDLPASQPVAGAKAPIDLEAVLKRCGGDTKFAEAVTQRFRAQAAAEVAKLTQALSRGDGEILYRTAHSLKSMSAYMSADCATDLARRIEELGRSDRLADVSPLVDQLRAEIDRAIAWISQNCPATAA